MFDIVLAEFNNFVNAEEHSLTVLAADTIYSHFQDTFSTTHYNIFVGENGSGKNSALLVFRILGYRVFYITAASAPNYYTFLGDIQEGQGTIAEDEADNIGKSADKKIILKTGYASGGCVPKVGFSSNGARFQQSHLTFCHKWFAMEELPDEKYNRGTFDRSFIHNFMAGDVRYNIKEVLNNKDSESYKKLQHLRKLLFVFRLAHHHKLSKLPEIKTNLTNRNAELTHFLLRMFYGGRNFERVRKALSTLIAEKSYLKSNGVEAKICESLKLIMVEEGGGKEERDVYEISNEEFYSKLKEVMEATDNSFDSSGSSFYLPDGTLIKKRRISILLASKFKAKPFRTNHNRGFTISKKDVKKISEQYRVVDEIKVEQWNNEKTNGKGDVDNNGDNRNSVTEVTEVTDFKSAYPPFDNTDINGGETSNGLDEQQVKPNTHDTKEDDCLINTEDRDRNDEKTNAPIDFSTTDNSETNSNNNNLGSALTSTIFGKDATTPSDILPTTELPEKNRINHGKNGIDLKNNVNNIVHTHSESVTSVTTVTDLPPKYPCYYCGNGYSTNIDFDMELHLLEKHKDQLLKLPIRGSLDKREEYAISLTKKKMIENSAEDLNDEEESG